MKGIKNHNQTNRLIKWTVIAFDFVALWLLLPVVTDFIPDAEEWTDEKKRQYLTFRGRFDYIDQLNKKEDMHLLGNKWHTYQLLKDAYKREEFEQLIGYKPTKEYWWQGKYPSRFENI